MTPTTSTKPLRRGGALLAAALLGPLTAGAAGGPMCSAHSTPQRTPVIELYTSEGCSSCPPADRWLSRLPTGAAPVALAFHVDYWDRLGWKDRFGSAANTRRQAEQQAVSGARFSYTPQVIVDGVDRPGWSGAGPGESPLAAASTVDVRLVRDGDRVVATVAALHDAPLRLAAYWAITEDGHVSAVKAGENSGATLKHDHVVREYRPVAAWGATAAPTVFSLDLPGPPDPAHPRAVNLVVLDAASGRPVQAVKLGC